MKSGRRGWHYGWVLRFSALLLAVVFLTGAGELRASPVPPNIVVVMVDDMAALDGRLVDQLPTIRQTFKDHGVTFADFHSESPLCCPARAGFLTGQYTFHHGVTRNDAGLFDPAMTIATQLHGVGYHTLLVGKYMNGYGGSCMQHPENCAPNVPPGWDHFDAFSDPNYYSYTLWKDGKPTRYGKGPADYSTDVISKQAVDWLKASPPGPLFAWIAAYSPHDPTKTALRYRTSMCATARWNPPDWNEADVSDKPAYVRATPLLSSKPPTFQKECRSLLAVDDLVAAVKAELAVEGRLNNTVFVFSGDNGMNEGEHRLKAKNAPYRTDIPFYLSWPTLGSSPRTVAERVQNIDFAPTICELARCSLGPFPNGQISPDGISFRCLLDQTCTRLGRDAVLDEMPDGTQSRDVPPWWAVITTSSSTLGLWHYIEYQTGEKELYDLSGGPCWRWTVGSPGDPCELRNRAGDRSLATVQAALAARLAQLKR